MINRRSLLLERTVAYPFLKARSLLGFNVQLSASKLEIFALKKLAEQKRTLFKAKRLTRKAEIFLKNLPEIDFIRIASILAVVVLHVAAFRVTHEDIGSSIWWVGNVYDAASRWCVPVFVMVSGALLLQQEDERNLAKFYQRRLKRIAIPLCFWTIAYTIYKNIENILSFGSFSLTDDLKSIAAGTPYFHLWFLYMIAPLYLFTPFIKRLISNCSRGELWLLVAAAFIIAAFNDAINTYQGNKAGFFGTWFLSYLPYFIAGYLIFSKNSLRWASNWLAVMAIGASTAATALGTYFLTLTYGLNKGIYFYSYLSITVIPMSLAVFWILSHAKPQRYFNTDPKALSDLTLGIYLIHPVFLGVFRIIIRDKFPSALQIPLEAGLVFLTSALVAILFSRTPFLRRTI